MHLRRVPGETEAAPGTSSGGGGGGDGGEEEGDQQGAAPPAALFEQNARDGELATVLKAPMVYHTCLPRAQLAGLEAVVLERVLHCSVLSAADLADARQGYQLLRLPVLPQGDCWALLAFGRMLPMFLLLLSLPCIAGAARVDALPAPPRQAIRRS